MFINFGAHDPNIDISDVEFESVNAKIVGQTKRFASFLFDFVFFSTISFLSTLVLRHREYNGNIFNSDHFDIQGRCYDDVYPKCLTLGAFS